MTTHHHPFASITADLLARKGDAAPSLETLPPRPSRLTPAALGSVVPPQPAPLKATPRPRLDKSGRRVSLELCEDAYERLGIAAAKHHQTRPQILRAALMEYLDRLACRQDCSCLAPAATLRSVAVGRETVPWVKPRSDRLD